MFQNYEKMEQAKLYSELQLIKAEEYANNFSEDEFDEKYQEFIKKCNSGEIDLTELPEYRSRSILIKSKMAYSKKEAVDLLKRAVAINPNDVEAAAKLIKYSCSKEKQIKRIDMLLDKERTRLEEQGLFEEKCIGKFWSIVVTRPYMRVLSYEINILKDLSRYRDAIECCEKVLYLDKDDHMGVTIDLLALCIYLEEYEKFDELYKNIPENIYSLYPLAIYYYKKGDLNKAKEKILEINKLNRYIIDILLGNDDLSDLDFSSYVTVGSKNEAIGIVETIKYLTEQLPEFKNFYKETIENEQD